MLRQKFTTSELTALPRPVAGFKGPTSIGKGIGRNEKGEEREREWPPFTET